MDIPIEKLIEKLPDGSRKAIVALIGIGAVLAVEVPPELLKWKLAAMAAIAIVAIGCQTVLDSRQGKETP